MKLLTMTNYKTVAVLLISLGITACDTDFSDEVGDSDFSAGDADFTTFVALGDSLTAGYADSALYLHGQENSYPNILAEQFKEVGGGNFTQPEVADDLGGVNLATTQILDNRLVLDAATSSPEPIAGTPTTDVVDLTMLPTLVSAIPGTYNNTGVPGAKSYHLLASGYGDPNGVPLMPPTANPYYSRFATSTTATMLGDAAGQLPTFFVLWIGNNDVLAYATDGGATGVDRTGTFPGIQPSGYDSTDITDPAAFNFILNDPTVGLLPNLTANPNNKGVLINIPDVNSIPFFTAVPFTPIPPESMDSTTAALANGAYASYNSALQAALALTLIDATEATQRNILFTADTFNAVVIEDESLTTVTFPGTLPPAFAGLENVTLPSIRQSASTDLLVLTTRSKIGTEAIMGDPTSVWGIGTALEDSDVLIPSEQNEISAARSAYNTTIQNAVAAYPGRLALFDAASLLNELKAEGLEYGTGKITADYGTGGGFSLDGVHPTARGYAVIANGIIDTINSAFNANVPRTDPGAYTTIFLK